MITGAGKAFIAGADIAHMSGSLPAGGEGVVGAGPEDGRQAREHEEAGDRGGERLRSRRRHRAGPGLRHQGGVGAGGLRAAGGQIGHDRRVRRDAETCPGWSARAGPKRCCSPGITTMPTSALRWASSTRWSRPTSCWTTASTWPRRIAARGPQAVRLSKEAVEPRPGHGSGRRPSIWNRSCTVGVLHRRTVRGSVDAFLEKREPKWTSS